GDAFKIADEIRVRVKEEIGLTISIGISFNKVFAKLGSDLKKPDAITEIPYNGFEKIIYKLPVENLLYVGRATKRKLNNLTIKTIGDLARFDENILIKHLGKWGGVLHSYALGKDDAEVKKYLEKEDYKSIGNSLTFYRDLENELDVETLLLLLAESVCSRMTDYGYKYARTVTLTITSNLLSTTVRMAKLKHPSNVSTDIAELAFKLFKENYSWQVNVRGLGVSISDFTNADQISFDTSVEQQIKKENLEQTIENLRYRFGRSAINRAVVLREKKFAELDIKDSHSGNSLGKKN
ncbi:MAG: DNA polymerase IV, partial [Clostridia bacterium]|nr:DNA polymerase IV [Clostridia bacterium]